MIGISLQHSRVGGRDAWESVRGFPDRDSTAEYPSAAPSAFIEEDGFLDINISGQHARLQSLFVRRTDLQGRLPIALIAHGRDSSSASMRGMVPRRHIAVANEFAKRGWLAAVVLRSGFGRSSGPIPGSVSCRDPRLAEHLSADAAELQAALDAISMRPDADGTRQIVVGVSAGGAAAVALSARNPAHLLAVVNVAGGLHLDSCPNDAALVSAMEQFGETSRIPNLWVYAENDSLFGPALAGRMRDAMTSRGASVDLEVLQPLDGDGHRLFSDASGRARWLARMDVFLSTIASSSIP